MGGIQVFIGDAGVDTDADGGFRIAGVTAPYDLITVSDDRSDIAVFQGLTRTDPTVAVLGGAQRPYKG